MAVLCSGFKQDSVDNRRKMLIGNIHVADEVANRYRNFKENQMLYGDGNRLLYHFTNTVDCVAHEIMHGIIAYSCSLYYEKQSGALNESISDYFAMMVEQWWAKENDTDADWLVGKNVIRPGIQGVALRSFKNSGQAYDDSELGRDTQVWHMKDYVKSPNTADGDFSGVNTNLGIPNYAFYCFCYNWHGNSWEGPGYIWYKTMLQLKPTATFKDFADLTMTLATQDFKGDGTAKTVKYAWTLAGVYTRGQNFGASPCWMECADFF